VAPGLAALRRDDSRDGGVVDYFLKIDGIQGESRDAKHKEEIELVSFGWGVARASGAGSGSGRGAGRARFEPFHFTMLTNKASPQLFLATVSGKHIKEASLSVRRAGKQALEYLKIKFSDLLVSSFQEGGGQEPPEELIAFDYGRIEIEYSAQRAGGTVKAGWDVKKNVKI
jgi:type VI secretion system secreted protein Hcp